MKIAFVVSEFNSEVTTPMEQRARSHAESLGVEVARVVRVPGVYDMAPVVNASRRWLGSPAPPDAITGIETASLMRRVISRS